MQFLKSSVPSFPRKFRIIITISTQALRENVVEEELLLHYENEYKVV